VFLRAEALIGGWIVLDLLQPCDQPEQPEMFTRSV
jgi:hypothetical protein